MFIFVTPLRCYRSKYGDILVTRNGNSSVTSTRVENFSTTSVLRLVNEKIASTTLRVPLSGDDWTSTALSDESRPKASATV